MKTTAIKLQRALSLMIPVFFITIQSIAAQDIILKVSGDEIRAKVEEISTRSVRYKKWSNLSGPSYQIAASDVFMIKYENGDKDIFTQDEETGEISIRTVPNLNPTAPTFEPASKATTAPTGGKEKLPKQPVVAVKPEPAKIETPKTASVSPPPVTVEQPAVASDYLAESPELPAPDNEPQVDSMPPSDIVAPAPEQPVKTVIAEVEKPLPQGEWLPLESFDPDKQQTTENTQQPMIENDVTENVEPVPSPLPALAARVAFIIAALALVFFAGPPWQWKGLAWASGVFFYMLAVLSVFAAAGNQLYEITDNRPPLYMATAAIALTVAAALVIAKIKNLTGRPAQRMTGIVPCLLAMMLLASCNRTPSETEVLRRFAGRETIAQTDNRIGLAVRRIAVGDDSYTIRLTADSLKENDPEALKFIAKRLFATTAELIQKHLNINATTAADDGEIEATVSGKDLPAHFILGFQGIDSSESDEYATPPLYFLIRADRKQSLIFSNMLAATEHIMSLRPVRPEDVPDALRAATVRFEGGEARITSAAPADSFGIWSPAKGYHGLTISFEYSLNDSVDREAVKILLDQGKVESLDGQQHGASVIMTNDNNYLCILFFCVPEKIDIRNLSFVLGEQKIALQKKFKEQSAPELAALVTDTVVSTTTQQQIVEEPAPVPASSLATSGTYSAIKNLGGGKSLTITIELTSGEKATIKQCEIELGTKKYLGNGKTQTSGTKNTGYDIAVDSQGKFKATIADYEVEGALKQNTIAGTVRKNGTKYTFTAKPVSALDAIMNRH
jgi:hypothetical protein